MHVVVTGASSGIGEALVREFLAAKASVTLVARRRERLLELCAGAAPGRTHVVGADLSAPKRATEWIASAEAALGPIDVLINNAGAQIVQPTELTDPDKGEDLLRLNVHTPMRLILALLPAMIARRSGTIVNVASMAAVTPTPGMFYYNASKAGLAAASEALRAELRGTGVQVITVYPGPVDTPMGQKGISAYEPTRGSKVMPWGTSEGLAKRIRRAITRREGRVFYPSSYATAGALPNIARWVVFKMSPPLKRG